MPLAHISYLKTWVRRGQGSSFRVVRRRSSRNGDRKQVLQQAVYRIPMHSREHSYHSMLQWRVRVHITHGIVELWVPGTSRANRNKYSREVRQNHVLSRSVYSKYVMNTKLRCVAGPSSTGVMVRLIQPRVGHSSSRIHDTTGMISEYYCTR
jgi:hypothetical protein